MRLQGQAKMGYYPTPLSQIELITTWLQTERSNDRMRLLDPCAGQGDALAALAASLGQGTQTYGIELSPQRAELAAEALGQVLPTGFENTLLTSETFSLILLNPPYDGETMTGGGTRMEYTFLTPSTRLLARGGVLVYIIPEARIDENIAKHLIGWYENLKCFRFTPEEYGVFKQVVIIGTRRHFYKQPKQDDIDTISLWRKGVLIVPNGAGESSTRFTGGSIPDPHGVPKGHAIPRFTGERGSLGAVDGAVGDATLTEDGSRLTEQTLEMPLPVLHAGQGDYVVPPSPLWGPKDRAFRFKYMPVSADDYLRAGKTCAAQIERTSAWRDLIPEVEPLSITPAMTPKLGHVSMQVSGGLLGTNPVTDSTGRPILIKGGTEKYTVRVDEGREDEIEIDIDDPDNCKTLFRVRVEERSRPILHTLDGDGNLTFLNDPQAISDLLRQQVAELAKRLESRNVPRYDLKPETWEWQVMRPLSQGRHLPGLRKAGLTDPQKHFAVALGRLLLADGSGFMNGEMGLGKTTVSLAVVEYLRAAFERKKSRPSSYPRSSGGCYPQLNGGLRPQRNGGRYPGLVVGPGIVTGDDNWPKEIREVIPGATSKVIDAAVRPVPKPARVSQWAKTSGICLDENRFEGWSAQQVLDEVSAQAQAQGRPLDEPHRAALGNTLKKAARKPPRRRNGAGASNLLDARIGGFLWLRLKDFAHDPNHVRAIARRYSLAQFIREYQDGLLPEKSFAILSYETAKLGAGRVPAMGCQRLLVDIQNEAGEMLRQVQEVCTCPHCGTIVSKAYDDEGQPVLSQAITPGKKEQQFIGSRRRTCQVPAPRWGWNPETQEHAWQTADQDRKRLVCGAPLYQDSKIRREAAARYVQRKARNFFPVLLIDEIHEAKAKGTGNGWALSVLAGSSPYVLGLTGTLFSGYATSIFWLMHRLDPRVRSHFGFHEERRWAQQFGLMRHTFYVSNPKEVLEDGSYTGARYLNRVEERPGILPAIIRYGLPKIVFGSLQDAGLPLPDYREEMVWLKMSPAMQAQYDTRADGSGLESPRAGSLYDWAIGEIKDENGSRGAISVWLNNALNRPNAMFREETVTFNRTISGKGKYAVRREEEIMQLPAVELAAPKDLWLAERCLAERHEGRKSLIFIRQTGKRDIQPHLVEILKEHGLRVGVLSPSVAPRRRVAWIKKHTPNLDVLLTNARLVKVGLNLRMFATGIFYEFEWSLAILWQAMRRVYRPGSPKPVCILFPAYENTLEERALNLIGQKMKAASLFYGDEVASALTDADANDFLGDLVRSVMQDKKLERAAGVFGVENALTASPMGSPTATSPAVIPVMRWEEWLARQQWDLEVSATKQHQKAEAGQQLALF